MTSTDAPATRRPGCDTSDMLHIHQLIRRIFADAPDLVRGVADGDTARMRVVVAHVREVAGGLHRHHHGEDVLLWDTLEQRSPACALHVGRMRAQHAAVAHMLHQLDELLPAWEAGAGAAHRESVAQLLDDIHTTLLVHLGEEEQAILPTASSVMSQQEWDQLGEHGMAAIPKRRLLLQLGWIIDSIPEPERSGWMRTNVPAPARFLWWAVGARQFRAHRRRVYGEA